MSLCPGLPLAGALPGRGPGPLLRPPHLPAEPLGQHLLALLPTEQDPACGASRYKQCQWCQSDLSHHVLVTGDNGKSHKPAYVLLVGTHSDRTRSAAPAEDLRQKLLTKFGNIFNIEKTTLCMDAHAAGSQEMKTLKNLLQQKKQQLIEVRESMHDSGDHIHIEQDWTIINFSKQIISK